MKPATVAHALISGLLLVACLASADTMIDPSAIDSSVPACQDFYQYACGNWVKRTSLPADQSSWVRGFSVVADQNIQILHDILSDFAQGKGATFPNARKLGDFYASCMDQTTIEKRSLSDLSAELSSLDQFHTKSDLPKLLTQLQARGVRAFFSFGPTPDLKDPELEIAQISQGGLGLPDSKYYTAADKQSVLIRAKYLNHLAHLLALSGETDTQSHQDAEEVFALEKDLAHVALPAEDLNDPTTLYHPMKLSTVQSQTPGFDWPSYFDALNVRPPKLINVTEPKFLARLGELIQKSDLHLIRTYLRAHLIETIAPYLDESFYNEWFRFEGQTLSGQKNPPPRWKQCVNATNKGMSEALGEEFVAQKFRPEEKSRVLALVGYLRSAFEKDLETLSWLDKSTRSAALEKLADVSYKIGYPEQWRDYSSLNITRDSFLKNAMNAAAFESSRLMRKIGGNMDPAEWEVSPQTVTAYYDPSLNQINFPAGVLQPPFFSEQANDAENFGAIGAVIGHEISHGFDTTGCHFDGHGAERDWWSVGVRKIFEQRAQCLIRQFNSYDALPDLKVNGQMTVTENIADEAGVKLAFSAYKLARTGMPEEGKIGGLNEDQQFFVSMAQLFCAKQTDEAIRLKVLTDPHSPSRARVNGIVANNPDFAKAFSCTSGSPMSPANRCRIW